MHFLQLLLLLAGILSVKSDFSAEEESHLVLYIQIEKLKKSVDMLNLKVEMMEKYMDSHNKNAVCEENLKNRNRATPIFDDRIDKRSHCPMNDGELPSNCAEATQCTQTSGYYNISVARYRHHTFQAFCDYRTHGGDWLHILQRVDGSQNFTRPWSDYVNGFGEVDREYWIGLENLYALTNYDGPQELYVYMENFEGVSKFARYDHFIVGSAVENYELKSLGKYSGTAGDSLEYSKGAPFSTYDAERDTQGAYNCALIHKAGWWFKECSRTVPTGFYHHGNYKANFADGIFWRDWMEYWHSMKFFVMMIRRQRIFTD